MSGKWLAKEETRLPKGSPASGTWVTNRIGFCTVTALGAAAAIARGAPATATSADAASASSSSTCPASAWGGWSPAPHAARNRVAARHVPARREERAEWIMDRAIGEA